MQFFFFGKDFIVINPCSGNNFHCACLNKLINSYMVEFTNLFLKVAFCIHCILSFVLKLL